MYPYQRTPAGNSYGSPISRGYLWVISYNPTLNTMGTLLGVHPTNCPQIFSISQIFISKPTVSASKLCLYIAIRGDRKWDISSKWYILPIPSMGLVYRPIHLIDFYGKFNVYIYICVYIYIPIPWMVWVRVQEFYGVPSGINSQIEFKYTLDLYPPGPRMQSWQIEVYLPEV